MSEYSYEIEKYIVGLDSNGEDEIGLTIITDILGNIIEKNVKKFRKKVKRDKERNLSKN